jgi:hypothetical protein
MNYTQYKTPSNKTHNTPAPSLGAAVNASSLSYNKNVSLCTWKPLLSAKISSVCEIVHNRRQQTHTVLSDTHTELVHNSADVAWTRLDPHD